MPEKDPNPTQASAAKAEQEPAKAAKDPVRRWTFIILAMVVLLLAWYLVSDRHTPYTSQARVHALVVPIAPEVSGTVMSVEVGNNQIVKAGQALFQIDPERYQLAVQTAEADLQTARQSMGASALRMKTPAQFLNAVLNRQRPLLRLRAARLMPRERMLRRQNRISVKPVNRTLVSCRRNLHWHRQN
jgi:multidrug resistance efflux pump